MKRQRSQSRSSSPEQKVKRKEDDSLNMSDNPSTSVAAASVNSKYTFEKPYPQSFAIPERIIFYIAKNPSNPKLWKKLIGISKYFYSKNQIVVVDKLEWSWEVDEEESNENSSNEEGNEDKDNSDDKDENDDEKKVNEHGHGLNEEPEDPNTAEDEEDEYDMEIISPWKISSNGGNKTKIDADLPLNFLLWINEGKIYQPVYNWLPSLSISTLLKKVYKCDLKNLSMGSQKLTYDEYLFLTSTKNIEIFSCPNIDIKYDNGDSVPFELILAQLPKVYKCSWGKDQKDMIPEQTSPKENMPQVNNNRAHPSFTSETAKALMQLQIFENLHDLLLEGLPESFDFQPLWDFIMAQPGFKKDTFRPMCGLPFARRIPPSLRIFIATDVPEDYQKNVKKLLSDLLATIPKQETRPAIFFNDEGYIRAADDTPYSSDDDEDISNDGAKNVNDEDVNGDEALENES